jgi:hypothetical protein
MKILTLDSQFPVRDSNLPPSVHKSTAVAAEKDLLCIFSQFRFSYHLFSYYLQEQLSVTFELLPFGSPAV